MSRWHERNFAYVSDNHLAKHSPFWDFWRLDHFKPFRPFLTIQLYINGQ
jgi:hypothetical protein